MRDALRQRHLFVAAAQVLAGPEKLLLGQQLVGDVAARDNRRRATVELDLLAEDLVMDNRAVRPLVTPHAQAPQARICAGIRALPAARRRSFVRARLCGLRAAANPRASSTAIGRGCTRTARPRSRWPGECAGCRDRRRGSAPDCSRTARERNRLVAPMKCGRRRLYRRALLRGHRLSSFDATPSPVWSPES